MIRVTVPRPVAEALEDGSLRLLVVEGEPCACDSYPATDKTLGTHDEPPAAIVRAIEAGERIGIDVECECACHRLGSQSIAADCRCTNGRVRVGSVRPVMVLPVVEDECYANDCLFHDGVRWLRQRITSGGDDVHTVVRDDLSVYGPAESLVGRYAVVCEDARREP